MRERRLKRRGAAPWRRMKKSRPSGNVSALDEGPLSKPAITDLDEIYQYIAERNPHAARNVVDAISDAIAQIAKFPLSAGRTSDPATHAKIVQKYPYKIYFEV